ncbi:hypothetical protein GCM10007079_07430 [Nocardiopsis terrae]|uniref:Uncharacterized protein n=1 Tax=Nocardiopsis terrae TaxID=372655 RepID=A0ABR9HP50_9ACTN|nr:hypothetical protein [Nocardiopsis terrae]MBE1460787.1 hypothetical protein [Nocardiopsis terrae]GHC73454.1 hypothetical protein GCM10007079_07430 [Nocardiopsis terrae]
MTTVETRVRSVLDAPRGHRFSRTPAPVRENRQVREQHLLRQMAGNPKVAHRLEHGVLPGWMRVAKEHGGSEEREAGRAGVIEPEPEPTPLPRGRHRRTPRRWHGWAVPSYGAVLVAGMMIGQLARLVL